MMKGPSQVGQACVVSVDPLEEPGLLLERPDPSHFWRGIDASLADKWSSGSRPSLFSPLRDRLNLFEPAVDRMRNGPLPHRAPPPMRPGCPADRARLLFLRTCAREVSHE